jgi:Ca2+-binding EF-hand superfamily protein
VAAATLAPWSGASPGYSQSNAHHLFVPRLDPTGQLSGAGTGTRLGRDPDRRDCGVASELQRRKVLRVFRAMDADGDGFLEESDFVALTARWADIRGDEPGSPEHEKLRNVLMSWWQTLRSADDHKITLDDMLGAIDKLQKVTKASAEIMFEGVDADRDGKITRGEYRRLIEAWNGRGTRTDDAFPRLDLDGDGYLSLAEFTALWTDFWSGDDPDSPGTWVFGRFELPKAQVP